MIGRTISQYTVLKKLGSGGMGEVYLAHDTKLDRNVALKVLPAEFASDQERMQRFVREAKAASAIDHPNIVQVYEINQADDVNFIAMQYVEGQTLGSKISGRPMPTEELLQLAIQVTDAMSEAHARGIIHRDLKPANIMITNKGHVKLLDFGLARIEKFIPTTEDSKIETMMETQSGIVMGTVAYMSPEQAFGKEVNHRTDIFSMGVVFYEMATGKQPFFGNNPMETIDRIVHTQPELISRTNSSAPQELERIIRKCMEKDPDRRYQSASDILIDLKNLKRDLDSSKFKADQELITPPPQTTTAARITQARSKYWIPIALMLAAAGIVGLALYRSRGNSSEAIRALAVLPFKNVNLDQNTEYLSDGITDSIINNISLIRQIRVMARGTVFTYKNKEIDPRQVGKDLGVDGVVTGKLLQQGNSLIVTVDLVDARDGRQIWGEQYDRKLADILFLQSEISKKISDRLRIELSEKEENLVARQYTENPEAYQLYLTGRYHWNKRQVEPMKKAVEYFKQAIDKDPEYAPAYAALSESYVILQYYPGGLPPKEALVKAKAAAEKAIEIDENLAEAHNALASVNWDTWKWLDVEKHFKRAIELNQNYATAHQWYAQYLTTRGRFGEALIEVRLAAELDPFSLAISDDIGNVFYWSRQYDRAIEQYQKTIQMDPSFAETRKRFAFAYKQQRRYGEAVEEYLKNETLSGTSAEEVAQLQQAFERSGWQKFLEEFVELKKEQSEKVYISSYGIAQIYADLGKQDEVFEWLNKTYQAHDNWLAYLNVDPHWDAVRSDTRFAELIQKVGLPPPKQ